MRIRILVAKPGLDGHDRGAKIVARAFRDAGFEVIYSGLHRTPEEIIREALQEDVEVLAISILSGAHMTLVPKIIQGLQEVGRGDMLVLVGGIIPEDDRKELLKMGVAAIFGPGSSTQEIVQFVKESFEKKGGVTNQEKEESCEQ